MDDFEILFVDDDRTILNMVEEYLAAFDYRVNIVDSGLKALELIKDSNLRVKLLENSMKLNKGLAEAGFNMGTTGESPIAAIIIDEKETAIAYWQHMMLEGVYVNLALPPATPNGLNLMRCSLSAAHTFEQIDYMLEKFIKVGKDLGVLS